MSQITSLKGVLKLKVRIRAKTGLHIGGSKEDVEIGGIDNIVVKLKSYKGRYDVPYIPGSSLKGKLRSLAEWLLNKPVINYKRTYEELKAKEEDKKAKEKAEKKANEPCSCAEPDCLICKLFGAHQGKGEEPVRLRVEDFYPTPNTLELWDNTLESGYTEVKVENMINRIKGTAQNPRHTERVIAGSEFEGWITIRLFDTDNNGKNYLELLKDAFCMLEDDYLGGSGSRGYGRVEIFIDGICYKKVENGQYMEDNNQEPVKIANNVLASFLKENKEKKESQECSSSTK